MRIEDSVGHLSAESRTWPRITAGVGEPALVGGPGQWRRPRSTQSHKRAVKLASAASSTTRETVFLVQAVENDVAALDVLVVRSPCMRVIQHQIGAQLVASAPWTSL